MRWEIFRAKMLIFMQKIFSQIRSYGHSGILAEHCKSLPGPAAPQFHAWKLAESWCDEEYFVRKCQFSCVEYSIAESSTCIHPVCFSAVPCLSTPILNVGMNDNRDDKEYIAWKSLFHEESSLRGDKQLSRDALYLTLEYDEHREDYYFYNS